ncbi:unnamed protein product [Spirodela intermedia]|uniref:Uncharacterized protein n=2 Tax=Spirodela intermedia TaxID=51605 RepID=A0A7I8L6T9_SPIIN|nr:unnamed protein product [Spirodela intermedia]CAA6668197.1 unnamed protein product [Spirodela intermedia]CAA7405028.1 unnamed protein product [Spirodela intermedia]
MIRELSKLSCSLPPLLRPWRRRPPRSS